MAITHWVGGVSTDIGAVANWDVQVPAGGDLVYFDTDGTFEPTAGVGGGVALDTVVVTEGFTGSIGSAATGWAVDATHLYDRGGGGAHYFSGDYTTAIINNSSTDANGVHFEAGTIATLLLFKGKITLEDDSAATMIHCGYSGNQIGDVNLTIEPTVPITLIWQHGGTITSASAWTTLYLVSGTFTHTDESPTNVYVFDGTFNYEATGETITAVTMKGGRFDAAKQYRALTITDLTMWPGSVVDLRNQSNTLVVTNPLVKYGGRLLVDEGITIALA